MRRRPFLVLAAYAGLLACPTHEAAPVCPEPKATVTTNSPRDAPQEATVPNEAALRQAALAEAKVKGLAPVAAREAPLLAVVPVGRTQYKSLFGLPARPGKLVPVEAFDLLWSRAPQAELSRDGTLTLRWSTRVPTPPGLVYFGTRVEEDPLAAPRFRKEARALGKKLTSNHEASFPLVGLLAPQYDVNDVAERGFGEISWRVEVFDPDSGTTVLYDGRTAFRLEEGAFVATPTVTVGPLVHQVGTDRAILSFETDVATHAAVGVGAGAPVLSSKAGTRHEIEVAGLQPATKHAYRVAISDGVETSVTPISSFRTLDRSQPLVVAIMSDSRSGVGPGDDAYAGSNADVLQTLFPSAVRAGAAAIFFPGDLIDGYVTQPDAYDFQLRAWLKAVEGAHGQVPVYTGMGNHEALVDAGSDGVVFDKAGRDSAEERFAALMVNPMGAPPPEVEGAPSYDETVYSVDLGPAHFVMLNTNYWYANPIESERLEGKGNREGVLMNGQLEWLETDLTAARQRGQKHIVVMGHEPAFPVGGHQKDGMWWRNAIPEVNTMRERFWKILAKHEVVAYVTGDEHNFSRASIGPETVPGVERAVWSIISGGCGAPYYAQDTPPEYVGRVEVFSAQQHYTLWTFDGGSVRLQVVGLTGEIIDDVELVEAE